MRFLFALIVIAMTCTTALVVVKDTVLPRFGRDGPRPDVSVIDPANPCGPVAAAVVARWLDRPASLSACREAIPCDAMGRTSMAELKRGLERLGVRSAGVKLDAQLVSDMRLPLIVFVNGNHFAVAVPHEAGGAVLIDPPKAPAPFTGRDDTVRWDGAALMCAPSEPALAAEMRRLGLAN